MSKMNFIWCLCVVNVYLAWNFCTCQANSVEQVFKNNEIVPDVVDVAPNKEIEVKYGQSNKEVTLGNELTPKEVNEAPVVSYGADPTSYYTLSMVDPDAPNRKIHSFRSWNHWLVVNIPGSAITSGETLVQYAGSGPPKGTGLHRYVFLVYKQPQKIKFDSYTSPRPAFSIKDFASAYGLGNPIAGNFFQAQYQEAA